MISHRGLIREKQEDQFYFNGPCFSGEASTEGARLADTFLGEFLCFAVCDGMGGTEQGERASRSAVTGLGRWQEGTAPTVRTDREARTSLPALLCRLLRELSADIRREADRSGRSAGTTIALLTLCAGRLWAANVGDSRIYRCRKGKLTQISVDHSRIRHMLKAGVVTPEQARRSPQRHVIEQYLGMPGETAPSPFVSEGLRVRRGDLYLLCSDGLTDMLEDKEITAILREEGPVEQLAERLLQAALEAGGRDNVTVLLVRMRQTIR